MTFKLMFPALLVALCGAATTPAQALPSSWNRYQDWVPQMNPSPDSQGNLVWSHHIHNTGNNGVRNGVWWPGFGGSWSASGNQAISPINRSTLHHSTYNSFTGGHLKYMPQVRFTNTTGTAFMLKIGGELTLGWPLLSGTNLAHDTPATVEIRTRNAITTAWTTLWSQEIAKPTPGASAESVVLNIDIPAFQLDPLSWVIWTVRARDSSWNRHHHVTLVDRELMLSPSVEATETVRRASPANPLTLSKGFTSRPIIGGTWDPFIASPAPDAMLDFLVIGRAETLVIPFGTLLCSPNRVFTSQPGVPFAIQVPASLALIGSAICSQGGSIAADGRIELANALDLVLGDR